MMMMFWRTFSFCLVFNFFVDFYHFIFPRTLAMSFASTAFHGAFMRMRERQVISNSKKNEWNLINLFSTKLFHESLTIQISHLYAITLYISIDYIPSSQALHIGNANRKSMQTSKR